MSHLSTLRQQRAVLSLILLMLLGACQPGAGSTRPTPFPTTQTVAESEATAAPVETSTPQPSPSVTLPPTATTEMAGADGEIAEIAEVASTESPTSSPTPSPSPTATTQPTATPTPEPPILVTRSVVGTGSLSEGVPTPPTPIPSPVPEFEVGSEITNILLLGKDTNLDGTDAGRTDTMIIVSINNDLQTASMVSLPRDLLVYMPTRTMSRLNSALTLGGVDLLKQAILYNFGIPIHYYAQVDFQGFKQVVDIFGGVEMAVSCPLEDWRIKSPDLDPNLEENYERYTLEPGMHYMDGDLALWFARSRLTTSDFDRGRRQQQLLQAMLNQGVDVGLLGRIPELWSTYNEVVETDMDIGRLLQLATIAPGVRESGIQHLYLAGKTQSWTVPDSGAQVQLPVWEGDNMMYDTFRRLFLPPALNRADRAPITVEIINATEYPNQDKLAADNLAWYGFQPIIGEPLGEVREKTEMTYFADNLKGAYEWLFSWVIGRPAGEILLDGETESAVNYRVILGQDYNPCRPAFNAPQAFLPDES